MKRQPLLINDLDPFDPNLTKDQQLTIMETLRKEPYTFYLFIMECQMRSLSINPLGEVKN
jgi:hypothetical protein